MTEPQIPTSGDVIGRAIEAIREARPSAEPHLERGRYANVVTGWDAQFAVSRRRLVEEVAASRLPTASGSALADVASMQYDTDKLGERAAIADWTLERDVVHYRAGTASVDPGGDIWDKINTLSGEMAAHDASVFNGTSTLGAHAVAQGATWPTIGAGPVPPMVNIVDGVNELKAAYNAHLAGGSWHAAADALNVVTTADAFGIGPDFSDTTEEARQSVLGLYAALLAKFNAHKALEASAGVIKNKHRFAVEANPSAQPKIEAADFEVVTDYPVAIGQGSITVRARATRSGPAANRPVLVGAGAPSVVLRSVDALFDASALLRFAVASYAAAGGTKGQSDPTLKRAAAAAWSGRDGPTDDAVLAGAMAGGADRSVVMTDPTAGRSLVWAVDESWAQSPSWLEVLAGVIETRHNGFGCRFSMETVQNRLIRIGLVVVLREARFLANTTPFTQRIQKALREYFNDRPDWYVWSIAAIRGVVAKTDRRILSCSSASVFDASGTPLAEPTAPPRTTGTILTHYWPDNAPIAISYAAPT